MIFTVMCKQPGVVVEVRLVPQSVHDRSTDLDPVLIITMSTPEKIHACLQPGIVMPGRNYLVSPPLLGNVYPYEYCASCVP